MKKKSYVQLSLVGVCSIIQWEESWACQVATVSTNPTRLDAREPSIFFPPAFGQGLGWCKHKRFESELIVIPIPEEVSQRKTINT